MSNQSRWLIAFLVGAMTFISSYGSYLIEHDGHGADLAHAFLIGGSALGAMIAALNYQLPRFGNDYKDRVSDQRLNELNGRTHE